MYIIKNMSKSINKGFTYRRERTTIFNTTQLILLLFIKLLDFSFYFRPRGTTRLASCTTNYYYFSFLFFSFLWATQGHGGANPSTEVHGSRGLHGGCLGAGQGSVSTGDTGRIHTHSSSQRVACWWWCNLTL